MKKRQLFISDIHGHVEVLKALLARVNYEPSSDQLVLLGDYVGQCATNLTCLQYIYDLTRDTDTVALLGNHDLNLWRHLQAGKDLSAASSRSSRYSYTPALAAELERDYPHLIAFLATLGWWYHNEGFVAVHAGFNPYREDWRQSSVEEFTSIRDPFLNTPLSIPETVVFGHTPCLTLHGTPGVWYGPGKIGIDGGAGKGQQLNCLVSDETGLGATSVQVGRD